MTIERIAKVCSVAIVILVVVTALGPENWQPRTGLGWEIDHVVGYFAITVIVCVAWPRPFVVGGALIVFAMLLEALQSLTPDRTPNLMAAIYGAGGVLAAALLAQLFIRARIGSGRSSGKSAERGGSACGANLGIFDITNLKSGVDDRT